MLLGEMFVGIVDPFVISNDAARKVLILDYLPMISEGAVLEIYTDECIDERERDEVVQTALARRLELTIYGCDKIKMHDRFITTSDVVLTIGAGLLFYQGKSEKVIREVSTFSYDKKKKTENYERVLAGNRIVSEYKVK